MIELDEEMMEARGEAATGDFDPTATKYGRLVNEDVITWLKPFLGRRGWKLRFDGKLEADMQLIWDTPWAYVIPAPQIDCWLWSLVMFKGIAMKGKKPWVPAGCQMCFKVVCRPQTLRQLFAVYELQREMGWPCKCGIELRKYVHGNYGSYWYCRGLMKGLECYQEVRRRVDDHPDLGEMVPVILKRGCTEMEMACGPSDQWEVTERQAEMEVLIRQHVVTDPKHMYIPDHITRNVMRRWIEHAYNVGDPTYAEYTGGARLGPTYVTYHHLAEDGDE